MTKTKNDIFRIVLIILLIATLCFIWGNSLNSRAESTQKSSFIVRFLEQYFGEGNVSEHLIRKIAHFLEFSALGFELMGLFNRYLLAITHGLFVALTDETIQYFTGRSAEVKDVLLDFSGCIFGAFCMVLLLLIIRKIKESKTEKRTITDTCN